MEEAGQEKEGECTEEAEREEEEAEASMIKRSKRKGKGKEERKKASGKSFFKRRSFVEKVGAF